MLPQYYSDDQPSGSTNYNAIFDGLTKIGAANGADKVRSMWMTGSKPAAPAKGKKGAAPAQITAFNAQSSLSRPLCPYPQYAKYKGTGNLKDAANWTCAAP